MGKNENWYTVSVIMSIKLKEGKQEIFPIFENFILVKATDYEDASLKAEKFALRDCSLDDDTRLNGEPAYEDFEGVRKIVEIDQPML